MCTDHSARSQPTGKETSAAGLKSAYGYKDQSFSKVTIVFRFGSAVGFGMVHI